MTAVRAGLRNIILRQRSPAQKVPWDGVCYVNSKLGNTHLHQVWGIRILWAPRRGSGWRARGAFCFCYADVCILWKFIDVCIFILLCIVLNMLYFNPPFGSPPSMIRGPVSPGVSWWPWSPGCPEAGRSTNRDASEVGSRLSGARISVVLVLSRGSWL